VIDLIVITIGSGEVFSLISWFLAAATSLAPSEVVLEPHEQTELILWLIVALVSLFPIVIFLLSYIRVRSPKLLITTFAFFLFFVKAVILAMKLFIPNYADEVWWAVAAVLDIMIISLIAFSLSKKA
jgi:hypothetical protein